MKIEREKVIQKKIYKMPLISAETVKGILRYPRFFRGHVRTAMGKIYKTGEFERRSDRVLEMKMP